MNDNIIMILDNLINNINSNLDCMSSIPSVEISFRNLLFNLEQIKFLIEKNDLEDNLKILNGEDNKAQTVNLIKRINGEAELNFSLISVVLNEERSKLTQTLLTNLKRVVSKRKMLFTKPEKEYSLEGLNYEFLVTLNGENNVNIELKYFFNVNTYRPHPGSYFAHITGQFTFQQIINDDWLNFKIKRSVIEDETLISLKLNNEIMDLVFKAIAQQFDIKWEQLFIESKELEENINQVASNLLTILENKSIVVEGTDISTFCTSIPFCFNDINLTLSQLKHLKNSREDILSLHDILDKLKISLDTPIDELLTFIQKSWKNDYVIDLKVLPLPIKE